jgi:peptidoglycan/xylan/chitin deacetylase (PgdA/CDA1 family)
MHRRDVLRAVSALTAGAVAAGCTERTATTPSTGPDTSPARPEPGLSSPAPAPATAALPAEISHGPRTRRNVALTFHGQGDPAIVGRLLDEVGRGGARITVLGVGTWLSAEPSLARRILRDGHELGNHTQHHAAIADMTPAAARAEIADCARTLQALTGSIGRWFRPSQTRHATPAIKAAAAAVGYPTCLSYDVDSRDYTDPGAAAVVARTLAEARPGSIVSLHFGHAGTVEAMAPLLRGLRRRGLTPVTMTELMR